MDPVLVPSGQLSLRCAITLVPSYGKRPVPGLRREEVASVAQ